jgi:hypothetical protein
MEKVKILTLGDPRFPEEDDKELIAKLQSTIQAKPDFVMPRHDTLEQEHPVLPDMEVLGKARDFLTKLNTSEREGKFISLPPGIGDNSKSTHISIPPPIPQRIEKYCGYCKGTGIDPFHEKLCPGCETKDLSVSPSESDPRRATLFSLENMTKTLSVSPSESLKKLEVANSPANIARGGDWVSSMYMKTRTPKMELNSDPIVGTIKKCKICSKKTTNRCSKCKRVHYCSQECQKKDWKEHKGTCKAI